MLSVNEKFPDFAGLAVNGSDIANLNLSNAFSSISNTDFCGKWLIMFFYPKDFTFVCPTELVGFDELVPEFDKRNAKVVAASVDSEFVHLAWRKYNTQLNNLKYPIYSDITRNLSSSLGILDEQNGVSQRATFVVNPEGIIKFAMMTDLGIGRNPEEVLRILDALQTNGLCPCSWKKGTQTIDLSKESV